jgi:hypothetical protein
MTSGSNFESDIYYPDNNYSIYGYTTTSGYYLYTGAYTVNGGYLNLSGGLSGQVGYSVSGSTLTYIYASGTGTYTATCPSPRNGQSMINYNNSDLIIFGGCTADAADPLNDLWDYNIASGIWYLYLLPACPSARYDQSAVFDGSANMIVFGGTTGGGGANNQVWSYNIPSSTWTELPNNGTPPPAIAGQSAVLSGGNMIIFGGDNTSGTSYNSVYSYNLSTETWSQLTSASGPSIRAYSGTAYDGNGNMIIFGGRYNTSYYNDVWSYNIGSQAWTPLTSTSGPGARNGSAAVYYNSASMVIFGGDNSSSCFNDLWNYTVGSQTWAGLTSASGPSLRTFASAVCIGNNMFLFGGFNNRVTPGDEYNGMWKYNFSTSVWSQVNTVPGIYALIKTAGLNNIRKNTSTGINWFNSISKK